MVKKVLGLISIFLAVFVLTFVIVVMATQKKVKVASSPEVSPVLIATDPSFPQLVGGYFPQIPNIPVYPDALLVGSAKTNPENTKDTGYRILWKSKTGVPVIMKWASEQFKVWEWITDELGDPDNEGEQVMQIANDQFIGTFSAEHEGKNDINIIVQILYK